MSRVKKITPTDGVVEGQNRLNGVVRYGERARIAVAPATERIRQSAISNRKLVLSVANASAI